MEFPHIDPVAFAIGPLKVHWYGLMYMFGFAAAWLLGVYRAKQPGSGWTKDQVGDLVFYGALGVIIGGRLGYVFFYNFDKFLQDPLWLFQVWTGGMSFHGGAIGVLVAFWLFARKTGKRYLRVADFMVPMVPIGLATGRFGNFMNAELWGRASDVSWAMVFPTDPLQIARHPSQLYEMVLEGVVLFLVLWVYSVKPRPAGAVTALFSIGYGCARTFVEFFREPDAHIGYLTGGWLTMGMLLSIPMVVLGIAVLVWAYRNDERGVKA
ncbi:MAG: prolipoprotein diacylglyceryl transferase [Alcanivorax borkumensis]|jgi:phosphatidylglycerol:prolipoprotein diacylglycerol transferase|uniref:Phosphatidylglycerol--prolipoprotein diacylglyceryl transferase n=1 Tax=Alcanivorax borkumensis (strain ATCC 700651 / DSM 11573 / NCIMB 13689 / SK2) TaxID=393595 RepID=Q0VM05_ALCBS|nr:MULTISPECIES: prolipoprotein diacylglyceryl transferase [Alcanivorax]OJH08699.1 MAG: prolipoprotein diacylglyceryl transferase [Alcanivorax borkumensis]EUC68821.1 prolipoprotein diacylglyceryl transferase [Alcanivorax sp. 97CO-5]PKG00886.1 prolipoprotein diacylglyceryl transferase [Alcanivorax sp. 97CO-6]CAL17793.1 Prolipoprotein diacylglyceryl transferase [Alcanivorax borkumensis SK2]BAP15259.1 prolipoprotein diacylglyceryl transferase [Alcanivorax sp. NBRC 101098]